MNYRTSIQKKETNQYQIISIEYLKGVLHTYCNLNTPNSNLNYEYGIIEFRKSEKIIETLKKDFHILENQKFELESISEIDLKNILHNWFFNNGSLSDIKLNDSRKKNEVEYVYKLMESILKITEIYKIKNLDSSLESQLNELGVFYEYLILSSQNENFILYFRYDD